MGVKNFKVEDLSSANLANLIADLRQKVQNEEFDDIQEFAREFANAIQGRTIMVGISGERNIKVNAFDPTTRTTVEENVNLNDAVAQIQNVIDESKSRTITSAKLPEREAMYTEVDKQLTALFKQSEMMEELASRGFDPAEFMAQAEKSNRMSEERINRYKTVIKNGNKKIKDVLGEDFIDPNPAICRKSLKTKLLDEMDGKKHLENISRSIAEIKAYETAITQMENDIASDPTLESRFRGNIDANRAQITQLKTNIEGAVTNLKTLNLPGFNVASIERCQDESRMTRDAADEAVRTLLYGTDPATGHARTAEVYNDGMNQRIGNAYEAIRAKIESKDRASYDAAMARINDPDVATRTAARKKIDDYMINLDKVVADATKAKKQEEILIVARNESVAGYQQVHDRVQALNDRFEVRTRQRVDDAGELLYIDADGNVVTTDTGMPAMEEYYEPKAATETEYLTAAGFDEAARRTQINNDKEAELNGMSWSEKRDLLKRNNVGNMFSRLFPSRLVRNQMSTLLPAATTAEMAALQTEKQNAIDSRAEVEINELNTKNQQLDIVRAGYEKTSRSAAVQQKMQDGAYDVARTRVEKPELIKAMEEASYEEVALLLANNFLTGDRLEAYNRARTAYNVKAVVDRQASKSGVDVRNNPNTPVHEDER